MPIFSMQILETLVSRAFQNRNMVWDSRRSVEFRPRKVFEGVEV
jgi:hypothetical protein